MDKKRVEPTPDNFESYEAAADFWDTHDTTNYLDEFRTVEVNTESRGSDGPFQMVNYFHADDPANRIIQVSLLL